MGILKKPASCIGCSLYSNGKGYAPVDGPRGSDILIVGEALGEDEVKTGRPFVGKAGGVLQRTLTRLGLGREELRVDNIVRCQPPNNWLDGAPWEHSAISHCSQHIGATLRDTPKVVIALGATATRTLLGLSKAGHKQQNWHGIPLSSQDGSFRVVSSFHPSFIARGNQKLIGGLLFDFAVAKEFIEGKWEPEPANTVIDPDPAWFDKWVDTYLEAIGRGENLYLAVDIETPDKTGRDEDDIKDDSWDILRINFSYNPDEGITVPWTGRYLSSIKRLLSSSGTKVWWNYSYDIPRLRYNNAPPEGLNLDFMWAWHLIQSDLPRGLGYVAPFYSHYGPWKHLSGSNPGQYAALDAVQTLRIAFGITKQLKANGQWDIFLRHITSLDELVLNPAHDIGLLIDATRLAAFKEELANKEDQLAKKVGGAVPTQVLSLHPPEGWARPVEEDEFTIGFSRGENTVYQKYSKIDVFSKFVEKEVRFCTGCSKIVPSIKHTACKAEGFVPNVVLKTLPVQRYYVYEPFNPNSADQIRAYAAYKGDKLPAGKKSKSGKPTTDKKVLTKLGKKDKFYRDILDYRAVMKVKSTYVEGTERRLKSDGRIHSTFTHKPSTLRLSSVNPNLQNVVADRGGEESIAAGYRACIVPAPGHVFIEADFAGIEAVLTGWFAGDPDYIRLAKLGVHAYLASHLVGKPAQLSWNDAELGGFLKQFKQAIWDEPYNRAKRVVHGTNYGLTPHGMVKNYPELFTLASATKTQELYFSLTPKLKEWQDGLRRLAARQNYLGGRDHPYYYKHWFWAVVGWDSKSQKWVHGEDSKRVVAFYPQSTAAGVLKEAALRLLQPEGRYYIGDVYQGRSPIRALVHDSILLEVPEILQDVVLDKLYSAMTLPVQALPNPPEWHSRFGTHLSIGVDIKVGKNWKDMVKVTKELGLASDTAIKEADDDEEEEE